MKSVPRMPIVICGVRSWKLSRFFATMEPEIRRRAPRSRSKIARSAVGSESER
ncbi:hypothetical protein D3C83_231120 [compost metagenome]